MDNIKTPEKGYDSDNKLWVQFSRHVSLKDRISWATLVEKNKKHFCIQELRLASYVLQLSEKIKHPCGDNVDKAALRKKRKLERLRKNGRN